MSLPEPEPTALPVRPSNLRSAAPRDAIALAQPPWGWLLRTTAVTAFVAAILAVVVAPGLRGLANDRVVDDANQLAWTLAYFFTGLLVAAVVYAVVELSRSSRAKGREGPWNAIIVSVGGLVVALAVPSLLRPLPPGLSVALAVATSVVAMLGGIRGLRVVHTRAVGALMLSLATAGLLRVVAWELARRAGDSGNTGLYAIARVVATAGLGFEGLGQMIGAAWLGTRSRFGGQILSSVAIGLAWVLTYAAAVGASVSASPWQAAAHIALATATSLPQPYGPPSFGVFLLSASILLAGVAAVQRRQVVAVVAALALALIGRGAFDVPIHALAATAGALWLILAGSDERAVWQSLLASRRARGAGRDAGRPADAAPRSP